MDIPPINAQSCIFPMDDSDSEDYSKEYSNLRVPKYKYLPEAMPNDDEEPSDVEIEYIENTNVSWIFKEQDIDENIPITNSIEDNIKRIEKINMSVIALMGKISEAREQLDYKAIKYFNYLKSNLLEEREILFKEIEVMNGKA